MEPMRKIGHIDTSGLLKQVQDNPHLWNRYDMRTRMFENSPHREVDDIWLRYRGFDEFDPDDPQAFAGPHISQWYGAYYELRDAETVIDSVMAGFPGAELGGVLITKIAPGKQVYRHTDAGYWHSEHYATKILILLQSAEGQLFNFDDKSYSGNAGDVFTFNNLIPHSVTNESEIDRISLILAIREAQP
jgi:hypothetical protein